MKSTDAKVIRNLELDRTNSEIYREQGWDDSFEIVMEFDEIEDHQSRTIPEERLEELREFLDTHDLDEEEYEALKAWVDKGNSPYTNPDHFCKYDEEVSFMKWYWILMDPKHPWHSSLIDHRYYQAEDAAELKDWPELLKAKTDEFIKTDYSRSALNPGQEWYMGSDRFLGPEETKKHLLREMKYIKAAVKKLAALKSEAEDVLGRLDITGNLFEDVLNVGELLGEAQYQAEDFLAAYNAINEYEDFCRSRKMNDTEDLPF